MKKTLSMFAVFCLAIGACSTKNEAILSLQGKWNFKLDRQDVGIKEAWYKHNFTDTINLASRQLYASLLNYMKSDYFQPRQPVASTVVQNLSTQ